MRSRFFAVFVVGVFVGGSGVAAADSDYDAHMHSGNALESKNKWSDALREFEAALTSKPGDAGALAEIGWTAYKAGNLGRAKEASEAAVVAATDPALRGSALFNLGLAIEKEDRYAAASLVFAGYMLRPNTVVEQQLVAIERKLGETMKRCFADAPKKDLCAPLASAMGKKLLAHVGVEPLPTPPAPSQFHAPTDDALVVALGKAGAQFEGIGMMKEQLNIGEVTCTESTKATPHTYECDGTGTDDFAGSKIKATGDVARAIVLNLQLRKISGRKDGDRIRYKMGMQCRHYIEADEGSDMVCDRT